MTVISRDPYEPLPSDWQEKLRERWPDGERLATAWRLSRDLETCRDLLLGLPVDRSRLRVDALARAEESQLVRLERPIDLVDVREAA